MTLREMWRLTFGNEGGFGSPSIPKPPPPPPPPGPDEKVVQEAKAKERARAGKRTGRASTLLAGDTLGAQGTLG